MMKKAATALAVSAVLSAPITATAQEKSTSADTGNTTPTQTISVLRPKKPDLDQ
jgi:hypothetical protein